eukprot:COSAG06_NODE_4677_length_4043_cov_3.965264_1_plen_61_part_00
MKGRRLSQRRPFYIHIRAAAAKSRENHGTSPAAAPATDLHAARGLEPGWLTLAWGRCRIV